MPIVKGSVAIRSVGGEPIGFGFGYLHLAGRPPRPATGSVTRPRWVADLPRPGELYQIDWADGRSLAVRCTKCAPTDCGPAIFKFAAVDAHPAGGAPVPVPAGGESPPES